jgi:CheY-like chemotaxis protein
MRRKIKVLLVDDNEDERLFMKEGFLQSSLYEIVGEAEDGKEALDLLSQGSFTLPDVILSDLNMPGKDGYNVIKDIKTHDYFSHIPVAILSNAPAVPFAERCKKLGACAYYTKPETFIHYKEFAEKIYEDLIGCLDNSRLNFSSSKLNARIFDILFGNFPIELSWKLQASNWEIRTLSLVLMAAQLMATSLNSLHGVVSRN